MRAVTPLFGEQGDQPTDQGIQPARKRKARRSDAADPFPKLGVTEVNRGDVDPVRDDRAAGVNQVRAFFENLNRSADKEQQKLQGNRAPDHRHPPPSHQWPQ